MILSTESINNSPTCDSETLVAVRQLCHLFWQLPSGTPPWVPHNAHDSQQSATLRDCQIGFRATATSVELTLLLQSHSFWYEGNGLLVGLPPSQRSGINAGLPCGVPLGSMRKKGTFRVIRAACSWWDAYLGLLLQGAAVLITEAYP